MDQHTNRAPVIVKEGGKNVAGARLTKPWFAVEIIEEGGKAAYDIHVLVKGAVSELNEQVTSAALIQQLQTMIKQDIRKTFAAGVE